MFDAVVVGAGLAGCVIAERLASQKNWKVLIVEKEKHIAGHCYDSRTEFGLLIHRYGPHLFHTNSKLVWEYLSQFTEWDYYQHHVQAFIDGRCVPLPFSFETMDLLFPKELATRLKEKLLRIYTFNQKVPILELMKQNDPDIQFLGSYIYDKVFKNYTAKQWEMLPEHIDSMVTARVPVLVGRDTRYFSDIYQAVPRNGYTCMMENMVNHRNIKLILGLNFLEIGEVRDHTITIGGKTFDGPIYYTGPIDELFGYCFGELPYRSLELKFQTIQKPYYQSCATINYPNNYDYTRITDFKHIHPLDTSQTTILIEYPKKFKKDENEPYYPVFTDESQNKYQEYRKLVEKYKNLILIGRLAEYTYYDMDDVVEQALKTVEGIGYGR